MRRVIGLAVLLSSCGLLASCAAPAQTDGSADSLLDQIVALERSALDRWINYGKLSDGAERELARWNSTEVYSRIQGRWKIIHSHWSYVQAQPKPPSL